MRNKQEITTTDLQTWGQTMDKPKRMYKQSRLQWPLSVLVNANATKMKP